VSDEPLARGAPRRRPPAPLSDLFATAVHRFGAAWADLVVAALVALAAASAPVVAASRLDAGAGTTATVAMVSYGVGYFALLAHVVLRGLPSRPPRSRVLAAHAVAVVSGVVAGALVRLLGPLAIVLVPLVLFPVPATAAGDASPLAAMPQGAALAARNFSRTWGVWALSLFFALPVWIGIALVVFPLAGSVAQFFVTLALAAPIIWPFSALFVRALYGDLTGRLVVAPEDRSQ
jgi:hypothetical protein